MIGRIGGRFAAAQKFGQIGQPYQNNAEPDGKHQRGLGVEKTRQQNAKNNPQ